MRAIRLRRECRVRFFLRLAFHTIYLAVVPVAAAAGAVDFCCTAAAVCSLPWQSDDVFAICPLQQICWMGMVYK